MQKTPDEIKKGLECRLRSYKDVCDHQCDTCDLRIPAYSIFERYEDALVLIQQLEAQNAELSGKIGQLQAERDAAVRDMCVESACDVCKHNDRTETICSRSKEVDNCFEWRGVTKEE